MSASLETPQEKASHVLLSLDLVGAVFKEALEALPADSALRGPLYAALGQIGQLTSAGKQMKAGWTGLAQHDMTGQEAMQAADLSDFFAEIKQSGLESTFGQLQDLPPAKLHSLKALWRDLLAGIEADQLQTAPISVENAIAEVMAAEPHVMKPPSTAQSPRTAKLPPIQLSPSDKPLTKDVMRRMPFDIHVPIFNQVISGLRVQGPLTSIQPCLFW